ncbi:MAG: LptA/OstA family protein, partial [Gammaproteobacteria bacterium]
PARISVSRSQDGEIFDGRGQHIEFKPNGRTVKLEGEAVVVKGRQSIRSRSIEYRLDEDKFYAGDDGRVRVVTTLKSDAS